MKRVYPPGTPSWAREPEPTPTHPAVYLQIVLGLLAIGIMIAAIV